jgi:hypothetical protein
VNAPIKHPSLADLHRQRADLLRKQREIHAAREKLSSVDKEAEIAAAALVAFTNQAANAVEMWAASGCMGDRPAANTVKHAALERRHFDAQAARSHAQGALGSLDRTEAAIVAALDQNTLDLEDQAALTIAAEMEQVGARAEELREQIKAVDERSLAVRDHFGILAEAWYQDHGSARHAFRVAHDAAAAAHGNPLAPGVFTDSETAALAEIEAQFRKLIEGS